MFSFNDLTVQVFLGNGISKMRPHVKPIALFLEQQSGLFQHLTAVKVTRLLKCQCMRNVSIKMFCSYCL